MIAQPLREQIDNKLDTLSEDQLRALLHYIEIIEQPLPPTDAAQDDNPLVGFFSAEPDFAERSEDILREEFGYKPSQDTKSE